ncbi:ATP-binding cassette domain-containing protein [Roseomonas alkaliterrae]|uniref:Peptide/nickel transport system ATP-binding protein n=1 Tax=Neoroseomonas alkaliterrae TaxID=1452450 RepID=A0A840Y0B6_9PROT|nr:oligopeptide/dipeptide ABC transporter ATP-binding protein [Neoroseomonas alkaliterrae]MBB5688092.1 peptide/nickel transport system ATP-binding protein [Neoroseomonas alkaliterrae]MBR0674964.1 ATP-binding cassette domain-containing protein [Neoroseomonas alkaliterrae]
MTGLVVAEGLTRRFDPRLSLGDRIAALLGAAVETRPVRAVTDVSFVVRQGETLGLVGESGCGKSTLGRMVAGILPPTSGTVRIGGAPVMRGGRKTTTRIQTVFQDPFASLNPRRRIGKIISEGPLAHGLVTRARVPAFVAEWLARVGLDPAVATRFPHQFSGGQRQRVAIARALAMKPDILVCDEPVASLDVSIQAQILNLFLELREALGLTCLFISHDLSVVRHVSHRVAIMYLGRIVEVGPAAQVYAAPRHPYTRALLDSVPRLRLDDAAVSFRPIAGELPSPLAPPPGCAFHPRCPRASERCRRERPELAASAEEAAVACHHPHEDPVA